MMADFSYQDLIGAASTILASITLVLYIVSIFKGQSKPHIYTWMVWTVLASIGFAAQISDNAGSGAGAIGSIALLCGLITMISIKYGNKNHTNIDRAALLLSLLALLPWYIFQSAEWSVIIISIINVAGFFPTFRKSWSAPHEEKLIPFFLTSIAMFMSLFAMNELTITTSLYPFVIGISDAAFVFYTLWRRKVLIP